MIYALAAADHASVSSAARWLNVSQPAVSAAIAALEQHYEMKIFTRRPAQGVTLTPFGMDLMVEIRTLCDQAQVVAALATPEAAIAGSVSICCYDAVAPYVIPRVLRRLENQLPDIAVRYYETDLEGVVSALNQGRADLAITYDLGMNADLAARTLYSLQPQVISAADHRFVQASSVRLADLEGEDLILLDQPLSAQYVVGLLRANSVIPTVVAQVKGVELQRSMVANGFGVAVTHTLPTVGVSYDGKPVIALPLSDDLIAQRILIASLRSGENRPILKAVQAEIVAEFAGD